MTNISITKAITMSVEDFQKLELAELAELHKLLADSKQKKALKRADLVAGVITGKKKAIQAEPKQEELVLVENSVKTPIKPTIKKTVDALKASGVKAKPKALEKFAEDLEANGIKVVSKPKVSKPTKHEVVEELKQLGDNQEQEQEPKAEEQETKAPEPKAEPSFKRPVQEQPDLTKMSQADLLKYIATLEQKAEKFPSVLDGQKTRYVRSEFESVQAIQTQLKENPYSLYVFVDERLDEKKTQFLVLFASPEIVVLLDRNRQKNTTITIEMKNVTATKLKFPKDKQEFEFAFYIREKK